MSLSVKSKPMNLLKMCSKIVGQPLQKAYELFYHNNLLRLANNIVSEPNHVLYNEFVMLPSYRRKKLPRYSPIKIKKFIVHQAVLVLNNNSYKK